MTSKSQESASLDTQKHNCTDRFGHRYPSRLYRGQCASLVVVLLVGVCGRRFIQKVTLPASLFSSHSAGSTAGLSAAALIKQQQMEPDAGTASDRHWVHETRGKVHHKVHSVGGIIYPRSTNKHRVPMLWTKQMSLSSKCLIKKNKLKSGMLKLKF